MLLVLFAILLCASSAHAQPFMTPKDDPLMRGLVNWLIVTPRQMGGTTWYPRVGVDKGTLTNMTLASTTSGWQSTSRRNATGEIRFDGGDDRVALLPSGVMNLTAFSVCLWFRATSGVYLYIEEGTGGCCNNMGFIATEFSGTGALDAANYDSTAVGWAASAVTTPPPLNGSWHHACSVQRAKNSGELYFNGVRVATDGVTTGTTTPLFRTLGATTGGSGPITGSIDDVRVYNRALSPGEVKTIFINPPSPLGPSMVFLSPVQQFNKGLLHFFTQP